MAHAERIPDELDFEKDDRNEEKTPEEKLAALPPSWQELVRRAPEKPDVIDSTERDAPPPVSEETRTINRRRKEAAELRAQRQDEAQNTPVGDVETITRQGKVERALPRDVELGDISESFSDPRREKEFDADGAVEEAKRAEAKRSLEDRLIRDFPENPDVQEIIRKRQEENSEGLERGKKEPSIARAMLGALGSRARQVFENLSEEAQNTVARLYDHARFSTVERIKLWKGDAVFRAHGFAAKFSTDYSRQFDAKIEAEQRAIELRRQSREKLLSEYPDLAEKELGRKMVEEDETAKARIGRYQERKDQIARVGALFESRRAEYIAHRAEKTAGFLEAYDDYIENYEKRAEPIRAEILTQVGDVAGCERAVRAYEEQLAGLEVMAEGATTRQEKKVFRKNIAEVKKAIAARRKEIVNKHESIEAARAQLKPVEGKLEKWKKKRKIFEPLMLSAHEKGGESGTDRVEAKRMPADEEFEERKKQYIEEEVTKAKEYIESSPVSSEDGAQFMELVAHRAGEHYDQVIANEQMPHVFREVKDFEGLLSAINKATDRAGRIGELFGEEAKNLATSAIHGHVPLEKIPDMWGFREAVGRLRDKEELATKGIPEDIPLKPEENVEDYAMTPEEYATVWGRVAKDMPLIRGEFLGMFPKPREEMTVKELEKKFTRHFLDLYGTGIGYRGFSRLDGRHIKDLSEMIEKVREAIRNQVKSSQ